MEILLSRDITPRFYRILRCGTVRYRMVGHVNQPVVQIAANTLVRGLLSRL